MPKSKQIKFLNITIAAKYVPTLDKERTGGVTLDCKVMSPRVMYAEQNFATLQILPDAGGIWQYSHHADLSVRYAPD